MPSRVLQLRHFQTPSISPRKNTSHNHEIHEGIGSALSNIMDKHAKHLLLLLNRKQRLLWWRSYWSYKTAKKKNKASRLSSSLVKKVSESRRARPDHLQPLWTSEWQFRPPKSHFWFSIFLPKWSFWGQERLCGTQKPLQTQSEFCSCRVQRVKRGCNPC